MRAGLSLFVPRCPCVQPGGDPGLPAEYRSLFSRGPHLHEMKLAVSFMVESATMVCPSTSLHSPPLLRRKESPMRLTILI